MAKEAHASRIYLWYPVQADIKGHRGFLNFLFRRSAEEEGNHFKRGLKNGINSCLCT
jgi:ferritin